MAERFGLLPGLALALAGALALLSSPSCLSRWQDEPGSDEATRCTSCHGDPRRAGNAVERSAPPLDLYGASDPSYPGVGAHQIHLQPGATHGALACSECHVVPENTEAPGHADDARPAEIVFGALASHGGRTPRYDSIARTCENGYCHGGAAAVWTEPRNSAEACGSCHGLPPAAPHPQSERCDACHGEVIDSERGFVHPSLHVNGSVEAVEGACSSCHGNESGAHAVHLNGGGAGRPLECAECHVVPAADDPGHADGLPAEVVFSGPGSARDHQPLWERELSRCSDTYCHGPSPSSAMALSPSWVEPGALDCASCHGQPPPAPHPQIEDCSLCHAETVAENDRTIIDVLRHVDGSVDVEFDSACNSCHGDENAAPPRDVAGNTAVSASGVGAHQAHVLGSATSRAVPCAECHTVPEDVMSAGHLDSPLPAELTFSGAALAFDAEPSYAAGSCTNTPCHGAVFPEGNDSGGLITVPEWTRVDGTQATCGSCHGLPPPAPHPYYTEACSDCHENVATDNQSFVRPDLHVDGVVTFTLP